MDFFKKSLDPVIALSAIAVLDIFMFLLLGAWTVGGGETMMTGIIAQFFMGDELNRVPFWSLVFVPDAGYWKIYISLDERNYFCSTLWCSYHEYILGITKNSVVEKNAKKHHSKRDELFALVCWWDDRFDLPK